MIDELHSQTFDHVKGGLRRISCAFGRRSSNSIDPRLDQSRRLCSIWLSLHQAEQLKEASLVIDSRPAHSTYAHARTRPPESGL